MSRQALQEWAAAQSRFVSLTPESSLTLGNTFGIYGAASCLGAAIANLMRGMMNNSIRIEERPQGPP